MWPWEVFTELCRTTADVVVGLMSTRLTFSMGGWTAGCQKCAAYFDFKQAVQNNELITNILLF